MNPDSQGRGPQDDPAVAQAEARADDASGLPWVVIGGIVLGLLVLPFGGLYLYGLFLPDAYEATATGTLPLPPETVYTTLASPDAQDTWRPGVTEIESAPAVDGDPVLVLHTGETKLTLRRTEAVPDERVVWTVVPSRKHVFEGSWTYDLASTTLDGAAATRVVVTERGQVQSAFARAVTHAFFGVDTYAEANITALARRHAVTAVRPGDRAAE